MLLLVLLGLIWGSNFLFMKVSLAHVSAIDVAWLRTLSGAVPILLIAGAKGLIAREDLRFAKHFAAMALLANVGPYLFFVLGTERLPSGVAGVISGAIPCITVGIVAAALPEEVLTRRKLAGLALGFAGVILVSSVSSAGPAAAVGASWTGAAAMLAGSVSYALALVYARRFVQPLKLNPVKLAAYQIVIAFLVLTPFADPAAAGGLVAAPSALAALVIGLGLVGTGIAFVIYYMLVSQVGAVRAASVYYIPPAVALTLGALFLGEQLHVGHVAGAALICAGIFYANSRSKETVERDDRLRVHESEDGGAERRPAL